MTWRTIGTARRFGDGIRIEITIEPCVGTYAIERHTVAMLLDDGFAVPVYQCSDLSAPFSCGKAKLATSRRMVLLELPGAPRGGAVQVSRVQLRDHYLKGSTAPVPVISPEDAVWQQEPRRPTSLPAGVTMKVV